MRFIIVNICNSRKNKFINGIPFLKKSEILPTFERYICYSVNRFFDFDELIKLFLFGKDDDRIGAISKIAEKYPTELYSALTNKKINFSKKDIAFLLEYVVPCYLPLALPSEMINSYEFGVEYLDDIWVKILSELRTRIETGCNK